MSLVFCMKHNSYKVRSKAGRLYCSDCVAARFRKIRAAKKARGWK